MIFVYFYQEYLEKYKYGNAIQDNLWESLNEV